ncbi:MAG: ChaN family lipoprotein, partial [Pontibacterium sp.]
ISGVIFSTLTQEAIKPQALLNTLNQYNTILVGETHNNPAHHQIEAWLLQQLFSTEQPPAVVFEMLDSSQDKGLHQLRYTSKFPTENDIKDILNWNEKSWPWERYKQQISISVYRSPQTLSGNFTRAQVNSLLSGQIPADVNAELNSVNTISNDVKAIHLDTIYEQHCRLAPKDSLTPFVTVQLARDAKMAKALDKGLTESGKAVLIAGAFHTDKTLGVPLHLDKKHSTAVIRMLSVQGLKPKDITYADISSFEASADYLWVTTAMPPKDYCAELKKSFGKH